MTQPVTEEFSDADLEQYMPQGEGDLDAEINRLSDEADTATQEAIEGDDEAVQEESEAQEAPEEGATSTTGEAPPARAVTPPADDELTRLRAENTRLAKESAERERQAEEQRIQNAAGQYAQQKITEYTNQGYDEQTARALGVADARAAVAEYKATQATLAATRKELSHQYGVPEEQLKGFNDESSMRHYAEQYSQTTGPQAKRIEKLEKELAQLKKGRVPAQPYNTPSRPRGATSEGDLLDRYNRGERTPDTEAAARRAAGL